MNVHNTLTSPLPPHISPSPNNCTHIHKHQVYKVLEPVLKEKDKAEARLKARHALLLLM